LKYVLCLYDLDGKLMVSRAFSCGGCASKRIPKTPACVRQGDAEGKIVKSNAAFKAIQDKVK